MTPIIAGVAVEELGLGLRVAAHRVMVQAEFLAGCLRLGDHTVRIRVDAGHETVVVHLSRAPRGADDNEVRLRVGDVDAALPVGHVDALHVGHRRRGARHGDRGDERGQRHAHAPVQASVFMLAFVEGLHILSFPPRVKGAIEKPSRNGMALKTSVKINACARHDWTR